ncbi:MAG: hypothetical protein CMJ20_04650 [Phycisphaeraceae bacterium]|nr:hypothetical protein [Phycisphaeraceae bacterium]
MGLTEEFKVTIIQPTMTDDDVMDFVAKGYVILEGIIDDTWNRTCATSPSGPAETLAQTPEFIKEVLLHPQASGIVRSLLGENFRVPTGAQHHLFTKPFVGQTWHSDGLSGSGHEITELQCYYYPRDVLQADGPTIILPGSHCRAVDREAIAHYGDIAGQISLNVSAGTIVVTRYGIWHRAGPKLNHTPRSMIKYSYFRQAPPERDWLIDCDQAPVYQKRPSLPYAGASESYREHVRRKRTWHWLCNLNDPAVRRLEDPRPAHELGSRPVHEIIGYFEQGRS